MLLYGVGCEDVFTHQNIDSFSDFAHALDKIVQSTPKTYSPNKKPFATHFLPIVYGLTEDNISLQNSIKTLFKDRITFITTESLLSKYSSQDKNKFPDPINYIFLKPPTLNSTFPFILCIAQDAFTSKAQFIEPTFEKCIEFDTHGTPNTASPLEKKLGLFIEHLRVKDYFEGLLWSQWFDEKALADNLYYFLSFLFIPNSFYKNNEQSPLWVLFFDGHGFHYTPYIDTNILLFESIIKEHGVIAGFQVSDLKKLIQELTKKITIALLHIESCFGGGINIGDLLKDIITTCPFFITTGSLTGETCVSNDSIVEKVLAGKKIAESDYRSSLKNFFSILNNATTDTIDSLLPSALIKISPQHRSAASKIFSIKPFKKNYFIAPNFSHLISLDQKKIENYQTLKKNLDVHLSKENETPTPTVILLYTNNIPICIDLENASPNDLLELIITPDFFGRQISLTSAIPGATFHIIKEIKVYKDSLWNYRFQKEFPDFVKALFPDIDTDDNRFEPKLFHIQKISGLINQLSKKTEYKMWISFDPIKENQTSIVEILLCAKEISPTNPEPLYFITKTDTFTYRNETKNIDEKSAEEWISKFEERVTALQKIAEFQAPYRLNKPIS